MLARVTSEERAAPDVVQVSRERDRVHVDRVSGRGARQRERVRDRTDKPRVIPQPVGKRVPLEQALSGLTGGQLA